MIDEDMFNILVKIIDRRDKTDNLVRAKFLRFLRKPQRKIGQIISVPFFWSGDKSR